MQIKRFEADDMNEALRQVKREFGDDAVILSAKEVRPGGFFSALRKKHVIITAAMDYQVKDVQQESQFSGVLSRQLNDDPSPSDHVSLSRTATQICLPTAGSPTAETVQKRTPQVEAKTLDSSSGPKTLAEAQRLVSALSALRRYGMSPAVVSIPPETTATNTEDRMGLPPFLANPFYRLQKGQTRIAFVGPSGTGKSSIVAKLAQHCQAVEKKRTALISLDRFHIGANGLLENVARIMNLTFVLARNLEGLQQSLGQFADHDVVLIDTPGMGSQDPTMLDDVFALLQTVNPDEVHLVINATVRRNVIQRALKTFSGMGVSRLLPTHLDEFDVDEYENDDAAADLHAATQLPVAFYGTGVDLFDGLQEARRAHDVGRQSASSSMSTPTERQTLTDSCRDIGSLPAPPEDFADTDGIRFLANRNSELFHHPSCKSVKRINAENIIAFDSAEQAVNEGFKPCRACCHDSIVNKSAFQPFAFQRASAI